MIANDGRRLQTMADINLGVVILDELRGLGSGWQEVYL
jgi:hypothetical protein